MRDNITDYALLLLLALIWSTSFLLIKIAVNSITPFSLTAIRLGIAALIFGGFLLLRREWIPMHSQALKLYFVTGLVGHILPFVLISYGETQVSSSLTAILMGIMPITTFVLAHIFVSEEAVTKRKAMGVGFGFSGLLVLVGLSALMGLGDQITGQLAILAGAMCYGIATVFVRLQPSFTQYKMAAGTIICAALISIPMAFLFESPLQLNPDAGAMWAALTLALFPTALASLIYFRIIKTLGATVFAQINYVIPVLGGMWGILFLGEHLRWNVFVALALVLTGVYLIQSKSVH